MIDRASENIAVLTPSGQTLDPPGCLVGIIRAGGGTVLVDSGLERTAAAVLAAVRELGWPVPPQTVLLTHPHGDHIGGAIRLHRDCAAAIYAHPEVAAKFAAAPEAEGDVWALARCVVRPLCDGQRLTFGEAVVTAFHTPGHTADGVSFLVAADGLRCIFSGDLVMTDLNPGWRGDPRFSIEDTLRSLARLAALKADRIFTGHDVVPGAPAEFLARALARGRSGAWAAQQA